MKKPYVEIVVDDKVKFMRYDFNAMADLEEYFGLGITEIVSEKRIGFSTIRALYWTGLKWKDKGLTLERTGKMVQSLIKEGQSFQDLMVPVKDALDRSGIFKKKDKDAEGEEDNESDEGEDPNE